MAEKSGEEINGEKITDILSRAALFLLPNNNFPAPSTKAIQLNKIAETFKIPFPELAMIYENIGCIVLIAPKEAGIENVWHSLGYFKVEEESEDSFGLETLIIVPLKTTLHKTELGPQLQYDKSAFKGMKLYANLGDDFKTIPVNYEKPDIASVDIYKHQIHRFDTAFHVFTILEGDTENFILETTPKKVRKPKPGKVPRSHERPYYTLLTPKKIRKKLNLEDPTSETGSHSSPAPHERRGHWRTYRDERYKNMRGKRQWIGPVWIGASEAKVGNKIYKVRLDL
ncbi:MAG: hypothetical protein KKE62_01660 [Proteobacteria bacterium]|nr:hypothetical protein [Pseudomonadota bacterium]MBU1387156.1 hypothetical protein [Pseudomonadota bacterium]MBU1541527.1 hypothetical protein [Pseudomonadota bacterium]MBU2429257.1 hypothetical protein [Pseudomonadota bacterium]MBU2481832.1 hypothetical protein [Pseudomonadota bacterium]